MDEYDHTLVSLVVVGAFIALGKMLVANEVITLRLFIRISGFCCGRCSVDFMAGYSSYCGYGDRLCPGDRRLSTCRNLAKEKRK